MNDTLYSKLKDLVETTTTLGHTLLLEDRINLVVYNRKNKIKSNHFYEYNESDIELLEKRLQKIAKKQRKKWESEFMRLLGAIKMLQWNANFELLVVKLETRNGIYLYSYNEIGFCEMADFIADTLLEKYATESDEESESLSAPMTCSGCDESCNNCKSNKLYPNPEVDNEEEEAKKYQSHKSEKCGKK